MAGAQLSCGRPVVASMAWFPMVNKREAFLRHLDALKREAERHAFAVYPFDHRRALHWDEWESWQSQPFSSAGGHWVTELVIGPA